MANKSIEQNVIHDIEEFSEIQKELTKFLRGKLRIEKLKEEVADVEIALQNIKQIFDISDEELTLIKIRKNK
jgi:uncharacterized protein YabN with tetrapyrrole methylase and pyrophosphatase domain